MNFDINRIGRKRNRNKSLGKLLKPSAIMAGSLKEPKTRCLSSDPNEVCDRLKLLVQEKQAASNSNIINEELIAITDKLLQYKCISTNQHNFLLPKCLN